MDSKWSLQEKSRGIRVREEDVMTNAGVRVRERERDLKLHYTTLLDLKMEVGTMDQGT